MNIFAGTLNEAWNFKLNPIFIAFNSIQFPFQIQTMRQQAFAGKLWSEGEEFDGPFNEFPHLSVRPLQFQFVSTMLWSNGIVQTIL